MQLLRINTLDDKSTFQEILKFFMREKGFVNDKGFQATRLAEVSGVSRSSITRLLAGEDVNPGLENVKKLAAALDVSVAAMVGETNDDFEYLPGYDLETAPICVTPYILRVRSGAELELGLPDKQTDLIVVPWSEEARANADRALVRRPNHARASLARVYPAGDDLHLSALPSHLNLTFSEADGDQVLGAIQRIATIHELFWRS